MYWASFYFDKISCASLDCLEKIERFYNVCKKCIVSCANPCFSHPCRDNYNKDTQDIGKTYSEMANTNVTSTSDLKQVTAWTELSSGTSCPSIISYLTSNLSTIMLNRDMKWRWRNFKLHHYHPSPSPSPFPISILHFHLHPYPTS